MGNNLPPGVSINDSDAPWNEDGPEPTDVCPHCNGVIGVDSGRRFTEEAFVDTGPVVRVRVYECRHCGEPVSAYKGTDMEQFLRFARDYPDEFRGAVDDPYEVIEDIAVRYLLDS